jgi:hypothetical protein
MPKQLTHLLLTRFNTLVSYAPSAKRLEANWLAARLVFFEHYCLPSVAAQRRAEFRWLVFVDAASPAWFKQRISAFAPLVNPIYIEGLATDDVIAHNVMQTGLVSSPYLVTTRLDNDDAIANDHIASVQGAFCGQEREFVTFPVGLQSFHGHLYNAYWPSNPFLSLIEKVGVNGQVTTVFCVAHDRVTHGNTVRKVLSAPQWLQVLHDANLENRLRGWPRLSSRSHDRFQVIWPESDRPDSVGSRVRFSLRAYGARADRLMHKLRYRENVSGG